MPQDTFYLHYRTDNNKSIHVCLLLKQFEKQKTFRLIF